MTSGVVGQPPVVPNVIAGTRLRSGFFGALLFLGGCLIGAPYYAKVDSGNIESGSVTPTGMVGWIVLFMASWLFRTGRLRLFKDSILLALVLLFFIWTWISFLVAALSGLDVLPAFISNLKTHYLLSFVLVGLLLAGSRVDSFSWFLQGVKWINLLVCFVIWYVYLTSGIFTSWDLWTGRILGRELMPGWGTQMSALLVLGLGLSLCDFLYHHERRRKLFELSLMIAFAFSILISINRSSWLMGIALSLLVFWVTRPRKITARQLLKQVHLALALLLFSMIVGLVLNGTAGLQTALVDRVLYFQVWEQFGVIDDRLNFWPTVVERILASPIVGYGGLGSNYISDVANPHSDYFDTLIRYGVPGFILLYMAVLIHINRSIRLARALGGTFACHRYLLIIGPFTFSCLVYGAAQYSFRDNVLGALIFLMIGYVVGLWGRRRALLTSVAVLASRPRENQRTLAKVFSFIPESRMSSTLVKGREMDCD